MGEPSTYFQIGGVAEAMAKSLSQKKNISHEEVMSYSNDPTMIRVARSAVSLVTSTKPIIAPLSAYKGFVVLKEIRNVIVKVTEDYNDIRTLPSLRKATFLLDLPNKESTYTGSKVTVGNAFKTIIQSYIVDLYGDDRRDIAEMDYTFVYKFQGGYRLFMIQRGAIFDGVMRSSHLDSDPFGDFVDWLLNSASKSQWDTPKGPVRADFTRMLYTRYTKGPYSRGMANFPWRLPRGNADVAISTKRVLDFLRKSNYGLVDMIKPESSTNNATEPRKHAKIIINRGYLASNIERLIAKILCQTPGSMRIGEGQYDYRFRANKDFIAMAGEDLKREVKSNSKGEYWLTMKQIEAIVIRASYQMYYDPSGLTHVFDALGMTVPVWPFNVYKPLTKEEKLLLTGGKSPEGLVDRKEPSPQQKAESYIVMMEEWALGNKYVSLGYSEVKFKFPSLGGTIYLPGGDSYTVEKYVEESATADYTSFGLLPTQASLVNTPAPFVATPAPFVATPAPFVVNTTTVTRSYRDGNSQGIYPVKG